MLRPGPALSLIAAAAVLVTAAPLAFAGGRPDSSAASRLAPWNAPNPFCRKNCGATATCTAPTIPRDQSKATTAPRAPGRWSR